MTNNTETTRERDYIILRDSCRMVPIAKLIHASHAVAWSEGMHYTHSRGIDGVDAARKATGPWLPLTKQAGGWIVRGMMRITVEVETPAPAQVAQYLRNCGWSEVSRDSHWLTMCGGGSRVEVPLREGSGGFDHHMGILVEHLASTIEHRPTVELLRDIAAVGACALNTEER